MTAPMLKMTTTTVKAHLREILSAKVGMKRHPINAPSSSMAVMKLLPKAVFVWGKAAWNWGMTLMMEMTPWSYPNEKPPMEASRAAPKT